MSGFNRGWNTSRGFDAGGPPPGALGGGGPPGGGYPMPGMPMPMGMPMGGPNFSGGFPGMPQPTPYGAPMPGPPGPSLGPVYTAPANGYQHPLPQFNWPGQDARGLQPHPVVNPDCPALNLQNSTGGAGCEPGYNYYFPAEHTKIHVLKSREAPWRLPTGMSVTFGAYHVPTGTTLGELMKGFGATNPTPKKNRITEVVQGGDGKWYKGVTWGADEKKDMAMTLRSLGWDASRTGRTGMGQKPVVWLWVTNT